jgi:hypothetical protein
MKSFEAKSREAASSSSSGSITVSTWWRGRPPARSWA